jgi:multiple sugar transport system substrate-binding protein
MARPRPGQLPTLDRRSVLKVLIAGAGLAAVPGLAACGSGGSSASDPNTVSFGSNGSDAKPKQAYQAVLDAFAKQSGGLTAKANVQDHQAFQQNINSYLQGTPDDVLTWFAGYRMQFFANKKLLSPIDDVWDKIGANFPQAV